MKITSVLLFIVLFGAFTVRSQEYHTIPPFAAGVRGSIDGVGANFRYYPRDLFSIEAQLNVSGGKPNGLPTNTGKSVMGVALAELNVPLYTTQFRMFLGIGMHYGSWERYKDLSPAEGTFGYDGILGFEYTFRDLPVSVSLDYKPAVTYLNGANVLPNNATGLALRYYFGKWHPSGRNSEERRKWKEAHRR
ncbi:MAG: hypothetical protein KF744_07655 [Taibaiella sp.]|nr:hypothetical protein [Taibaiella sp.]